MGNGFLQIASWNIEHLSGASRADKKQSVYALADHIEMAGIDIIALQEVYVTNKNQKVRLFPNQPVITSRADSDRRNSDLDMVCYLLEEHTEDPWKYLILPNRNSGDKSQLCAVMWNATRAEKTCDEIEGEAQGRRPQSVEPCASCGQLYICPRSLAEGPARRVAKGSGV